MSIAHEHYTMKQRSVPQICPPTVRIAKRSDSQALFELVMNGVAKESAIAPVNEVKVASLIQEVLKPVVSVNTPRPVVAVIDGPDGKLAAAAPIIPRQWWYSADYHLVQPWIYVPKEHSGKSYARTLVETCAWWSDKVALPMLSICSAIPEFKDRRQVYSRYSKPFGGSFIHAGGGAKPTPKPFNVRVATTNDYAVVKDMCLLLNAENAYGKLTNEYLEEVLANTLTQKRGIVAIVMDKEGKPVGCACLGLDQWDYSLAWHYMELWVFVRPEHRKQPYGADLLHFCKWWAEQTGIPITVGITSTKRTQAKMRFYARHLKPLEVFFLHDAGASTVNVFKHTEND